MANPVYWTSPFGAVKRLRISPHCIQRASTHICQQRAGLADVAEPSSQAAANQEDIVEQTIPVEDAVPAEAQKPSIMKQAPTKPPASPQQPPGFEYLGGVDPRTKELLFHMNLPPNVQSVYLRPLRRAPTHNIPVCDLQLRSYSVRNLEFFADFAMRTAYYLGLPAKGPVPLPQITERWTVPRSPFVHKKSQENFERKTMRRLIQIQDGHQEVVQAWLAYLEKRAYYGVGMKANVFEWEGLDVAKKMDENASVDAEQAMANEPYANFGAQGFAIRSLEKTMDEQPLGDLLQPKDDTRRRPIEVER